MNKPVFLTAITFKLQLFFSAIFLFLLTACNPVTPTTDLEDMQARQTLIMGTMNSALTYSFDGDNYSGLDYELGKKFAKYLHLKLIIKEYDDLDSLFSALEDNEIDFAGAGLTLTPKRAEKYRSSPPYYYLSQTLVYHKGTYRPRDIADIDAPVNVLKGSSHEENIKASLVDHPDLVINVLENEDQESLLQKVAQKEIRYAIVDSTTLAQKQRYYPALAEAFTIYEKQPVAWLIRKAQDDSLYSAMIEFMGNQYNSGTIAKVEEKYFGHIGDFDYVDTRIFLKRIDSRLPKYETLFKQYATPEVPWLLLASISYQESHWNPKATSPTGVRGMMMLTLDTAKFVGIKNRLNAEQSIQGGAKYLTQLIKRLPESIPEDERIWFALASYNIGLGHLLDVRRITKMKGQNPDSWAEVKENLPLLHERKWYTKTRYGYARGREAKHYVDNIREYLETLTWHAQEQEKALKLAEEQKAEEARLAAIAKAEEERLAAIELEKQKKLEEEALAEEQRQAAIEAENQARIIADKEAKKQAELAAEKAKQAALEAAEKAKADAAAKLAAEQKAEAEAAAKLAAEQKAEAAAKLAAEKKAEVEAKLAEEQTETTDTP
ncbi:membrane-bound lytic murein transglycosylase MltF [Psychromonas sp. B3M02]|uniref:membrane-bound lytic murein transglycosylase MltF n=1 Tax=Psychromonas sp. B3M02 TaxID=2267226 RepID=UPI000DEB1633|nr:membrane-bound lytic murein transglycosylase MltF [Psychromonas sp. B3M02]RBW48037.1 membrane-bound lytic murein transglycosylase MltF [Psychromonas sp. B3M02]